MADYRFERTDEDIRRAFIQAVHDQGFERLSIAQLAKLSRVDRSTFYAHYDSLYDLAETMIQEQVTGLFHDLKSGVSSQQNNYDFFSESVVARLVDHAQIIQQLRLISLGTQSFDAVCRQLFSDLYTQVLGITATSYTNYLFVNMAMSDLDFVLRHHRAPERQELQGSLRKMIEVLNKITTHEEPSA